MICRDRYLQEGDLLDEPAPEGLGEPGGLPYLINEAI